MNEQNKDNLEKFFKEGAQKYNNIEFEEGDWHKLEAQLDREMPVAFSFHSFLKKFWPIPLLIALAPLAWYAYSLFSMPEISKPGSTEIAQETGNGDSPGNISVQNELSEENIPSEKIVISGTSRDIFPETSDLIGDQYHGSYMNSGNSLSQSSSEVNMGQSTSISQGISNIKDVSFTSDELIYKNDLFAINKVGLPYNYPETPVPGPVGITLPNYPEQESLEDNAQPEEHKVSLYAGLGFSPDFSTVGLGNFIEPGFRWNAMMEVEFSNRFSLNTGIIWVKNKYEAIGEEYHAPSGYWKNGITADATYGKCVMLDVPLNVRYKVFKKERHQIFISGGSSTYFLLKEDYYFDYEQDDPSLPTYWGTNKTSIYPFGIVNLSFGYQYQLGRRGALQVEPFIKLPMGGVGWGDVKLHTIGVYFIYKYRIGK
jgi:hypothetical protein